MFRISDKKVSRPVCVIMAVVFFAVSMAVFNISTAYAAEDAVSRCKEKGRQAIEAFFNPSSYKYFGDKLNSLFSDENLKHVQSKAENSAKSRGDEDTKKAMEEVMRGQIEEKIFTPLMDELKSIASDFERESCKLKSSVNIDASKLDALVKGLNGFALTVGVGALVIAAYAAISATFTTMFGAFIITTASGLSLWAIITSLACGPWGWVFLGGVIVGSWYGYDHYKKQLEENRKKSIEALKVEIGRYKADLLNKWDFLFIDAPVFE